MPNKPAEQEDEQHRKFREALEAKKAQKHLHAESARNRGKSPRRTTTSSSASFGASLASSRSRMEA